MEVVILNGQTPVYKYSVENNISTQFWPPTLNGSYDFGIIVSFGKLIPKKIIQLFPLGILNVHASLLPKYRGGMPVVHALKNGEITTGVTVTKIHADKFDVGEIILQKPCAIGKNELLPSLYNRLIHLGCECLMEVFNGMPECLEKSFPQSKESISYAHRLNKKDAVVKWDEMTAVEIFNLHRALFGVFELASTFRGQPVKFVCMFLSNPTSKSSMDEGETNKPEPGSFTYDKLTKSLNVQCKEETITVCTMKYRQKMHKASSFYTGYLHNLPRMFWKFGS